MPDRHTMPPAPSKSRGAKQVAAAKKKLGLPTVKTKAKAATTMKSAGGCSDKDHQLWTSAFRLEGLEMLASYSSNVARARAASTLSAVVLFHALAERSALRVSLEGPAPKPRIFDLCDTTQYASLQPALQDAILRSSSSGGALAAPSVGVRVAHHLGRYTESRMGGPPISVPDHIKGKPCHRSTSGVSHRLAVQEERDGVANVWDGMYTDASRMHTIVASNILAQPTDEGDSGGGSESESESE